MCCCLSAQTSALSDGQKTSALQFGMWVFVGTFLHYECFRFAVGECVCLYVCVSEYMSEYVCVYICVSVCECVCICVYVCASVYVSMCVCVCVC